jgi:hypothetical protein
VEDHAGHLAAADGDHHRQRTVGQRRVVMPAEAEPEDPARAHVQHAVEVQLSLPGSDLGTVAVPTAVDPACGELAPDLVRWPPPAHTRPGRRLAALLAPGGQALFAHQARHGVLAHLPARIPQRGASFNPLVQGSTPWRPTSLDLRFLLVRGYIAVGLRCSFSCG